MNTDKNCGCAPECCTIEEKEVREDGVRTRIREGYVAIAKNGVFSSAPEGISGICGSSAGGCCGPVTSDVSQLVNSIGYSQGELSTAPEGANMGLSCGNPTAIADLRLGEIVLDLGSGGGLMYSLPGQRLEKTGRVIGVDMTPEMISNARKNAAVYSERTELDNVEFRLGEIEHLPVADKSVDVVISNCVLNLSPDKAQVWREIARVLKPGGRAAISDLALLQPLPQSIANMIEALVGCVAGASLVTEIETTARAAGFKMITIQHKTDYVAAMMNAGDPLYKTIVDALPTGSTPFDFITSVNITAAMA